MHLQENNCLIFDLDVAQSSLNHLTNTPAKFEDATSYGLGGDTIAKTDDVGPTLVKKKNGYNDMRAFK